MGEAKRKAEAQRIDWSDEAQWVGIPAEPIPGEEPLAIANMPAPGSPFIAIAVPCMDFVDTEFSLSFAVTMASLRALTCMLHTQSAYIDEARQQFVDQAKRKRIRLPDGTVVRPSHLMQIDSDMTFPPTAIPRLLSHGIKDVVGCVYSRRVEPFTNIGVTVDKSIENIEDGLVEMQLLPTGMLLIHMSVFDRMPEYDEDGPAFGFRWVPEVKKYEREDVRFCRLVRENGMKVWADIELSKQIGHVGKAIYTVDEATKRAARESYGAKASRNADKPMNEQPVAASVEVEMVDVARVAAE